MSKKAILTEAVFTFEQEGNCIEGGDEAMEVKILADDSKRLNKESSFITINTQQWSIDSVEELSKTIQDCLVLSIKINNESKTK